MSIIDLIPILSSIITGLTALGGVLITQRYYDKRNVTNYKIEQKIKAFSELQYSLHSVVEEIEKFSFQKVHNKYVLELLKEDSKENLIVSTLKPEKRNSLIEELESNIDNLAISQKKFRKAYYLVNIHLDDNEETIFDEVFHTIMSLSESLINKSRYALMFENDNGYPFINLLEEKMEEATFYRSKTNIPKCYGIIKENLLKYY